MLRVYATCNPLRTFALIDGLITIVGAAPTLRFLWFWLQDDGQGHIQSQVPGGALLVFGSITCLVAILADLVVVNQKLIEATLNHVRQIEAQVNGANADTTAEHARRKSESKAG